MCRQRVYPREGRGTKGQEEKDGWAGEALVLNVFRGREGGFGGLCEALVVLENTATFSKRSLSWFARYFGCGESHTL